MAMNQDTGEFRDLLGENLKELVEELEPNEIGVFGQVEKIERLSEQIKKANQLEDDKCPSSD